jgi:hypothetical protein
MQVAEKEQDQDEGYRYEDMREFGVGKTKRIEAAEPA